VGLAFGALSPKARLYAVEPEAYDDHAQSLSAGYPVAVKPAEDSLLDALLSPAPGAMTFALNSKQLSGALGVSDQEALAAIAFAFRHLKLVIEPGGAVALAALLCGRVKLNGGVALVIASGGNVDPAVYVQAIGG
ncbi:MAG: pyridoxal-phosphate dependent enzyme, partial [Caulobacteraceae bacterium]